MRAENQESPVDVRVTLIVTPRERYGVAKESLESIYECTTVPFELIYVDGAGPKPLASWLRDQSRERGFDYVEAGRFLTPNEARNIGLSRATTPFVIFIDNDVVCSPNWVEALLTCADETGAAVIAPLTCQGLPLHHQVHQAGGTFTDDVTGFFTARPGERIIEEVMHFQGETVDTIPRDRIETQCCEFHCVMVRRSIFDRIGSLDEEMLATKEHIDFCMSVIAAGGKVVLEPASVVTYLFPASARPMNAEDWPYFLVRWSESWQRRSLVRFQQKWGLDPAQEYFKGRAKKYGWRYHEGVVKPFMKKVPGVRDVTLLRKIGGRLVRPFVSVTGKALTAAADRRRRIRPAD